MGTIYIGDIHGNFDFLNWYVKAHNIRDCDMVQVGDFGIGFKLNSEGYALERVNKTLNDFNVNLYVIRGNHDNPKFFDGTYREYDRINFMSDYSTLVLGNKKHLFVGGAISIDRKYRTVGMDYWKDEKFVLDEEKLAEMVDVDVLVTHNAMSFLPPVSVNKLVLDFAAGDSGLLDELMLERNEFRRMWDILTKEKSNKIELHVYGHFHFDQTTYLENTKHVLLSINKAYEHR